MATRWRLVGNSLDAMHQVPDGSVSTDFKVFESIGSGSFSSVFKLQRRETGEMFACKKLNKFFSNWDDPREVYTALNVSSHPNIIQLFEVHFARSPGLISLIYEMMDCDLLSLIRPKQSKEALPDNRILSIMSQMLSGIAHLHTNGIMHCDLKPDNILIKKPDYLVKLGDFGNVQLISAGIPRTQTYAATRWYRPPECLLTNGYYGQEMDIWAAGCIFYELMKQQVLFRGDDEIDTFLTIECIIGQMPVTVLQQYFNYINSDPNAQLKLRPRALARREERNKKLQKLLLELYECRDPLRPGPYMLKTDEPQNVFNRIENLDARSLLLDFLQYDPKFRPTAQASLCHAYFKEGKREE